MKNYRFILLDWDGNLAKTLDIWLEAFREVLARRDINVTDTEIAASFGAFSQYASSLGIDDGDAAMDEADSLAKHNLPNVELYPDALEVLTTLKATQHKLALITTSPHKNVGHLLEKHNLTQLFDVIVAGDDVTHHKPHAEPLMRAIELLGGDKDSAVMIGDSDKDLGAAINAGIDSILFYPPEHQKFYDLHKLKQLRPTFIVEDFKDIIEICS